MLSSWQSKTNVGNMFSKTIMRLHIHRLAGKKWSTEKLASRLEEGSSIVKAVYRYGRYVLIVVPLPIPTLSVNCQTTMQSSQRFSPSV